MEYGPIQLVDMKLTLSKYLYQIFMNIHFYVTRTTYCTILCIFTFVSANTLMAQSYTDDQKVIVGPSGQSYQTVLIGEQLWLKENLNTDRFRNGDLIQEAQTHNEWQEARNDSIPVWSHYDNDPNNGASYGKLYNWHAVIDPRGICPVGWRVPKEADRKKLMVYLGMKPEIFDSVGWRGEIAPALSSRRTAPDPHPRWDAPNELATNSSGFSALPGGYRVGNPIMKNNRKNLFRYIGKEATFWSGDKQIGWGLWTDRRDIFKGGSNLSNGFGFSVRCIQK